MLSERRSIRFTLLFQLPEDRGPATVTAALMKTVNQFPRALHPLTHLGSGQGARLPHQVHDSTLGSRSNSATPRTPGNGGTAENINGLLRQYMPMGIDLSTFSQVQLDAIAAELNERPRKTLDWDSPANGLCS